MRSTPRFRRTWVAPLLAIGLAAALGACNKDGATGQAQGAPGGAPGGAPAAPKQPPVPVAVAAAATGSIASYYTATATLAADKEAEILARVSGVVEKLYVVAGQTVK